MTNQMEFPDTWEEYEKEYGFEDSEKVYTNYARLIPSFRVKQWLEHKEKAIEDIKAEIRKGLDIIGTCEDYEQGYDNATKRALMIIDKHMTESEVSE